MMDELPERHTWQATTWLVWLWYIGQGLLYLAGATLTIWILWIEWPAASPERHWFIKSGLYLGRLWLVFWCGAWLRRAVEWFSDANEAWTYPDCEDSVAWQRSIFDDPPD